MNTHSIYLGGGQVGGLGGNGTRKIIFLIHHLFGAILVLPDKRGQRNC